MRTARARLFRDWPLFSSWPVVRRSSGSLIQSNVNSVRSSRPNYQFGQMGKLTILNRVRQQPTGQFSGRACAKRAKPKPILQFRSMTPTVLFRNEIVVDGFRQNINLLTNKRDKSSRRSFGGVQRTTGVTLVAQHNRIAEAVVVTTAALDHCNVYIEQCVVAHQLTLIGKRVEQRGEFRRRDNGAGR
jgi:hypothetical protein